MLIVARDADSLSAGSFFKNPVLSEAKHEDLKQRAAVRGLTCPAIPHSYPQESFGGLAGRAFWIHQGLWLRPRRHFEQACASHRESRRSYRREVIALKEQIQHRVEEIWGIHLEPEPVMVGF